MADSSSLRSWLETLPIKEMISHCKGSLTLSCAERSPKTHLIDRILNERTPNDFVTYLVQKAKERGMSMKQGHRENGGAKSRMPTTVIGMVLSTSRLLQKKKPAVDHPLDFLNSPQQKIYVQRTKHFTRPHQRTR